MQERFNKDLEEIKESQYKTNKQNFSKIRIEADTGVCAVMCV